MTTTSTTAAHRTPRTWVALAAAIGLALAVLVPATSLADDEGTGGPVILMGLDSELTPGRASHGPPEDHQAMVDALLDAVRNGGEGILVIGPDTGNFESYWVEDIGDPLGVDVTFVNGVEDIEEVDFDGYAMIGVASSFAQVSGGLTNAENEALISRDLDIAEFINQGGGLLGKTQDGMADPFGYMGPLGTFQLTSTGFSSVEVTPAGLDLGLTQDGMDGWCCYHEVFEEFPDFMEVLITHDDGGTHQEKAAAIGGVDVTVPTGIDLEPGSATLDVGDTHELRAIVEEDDAPAEDVEVSFTVIDGPHEGLTGTAETDEDGIATFSYEGTAAGDDRVRASFVDVLERERSSNEVTVEWVPAPDSLSLSPSEATGTVGEEHTLTATLTDSEGAPLDEAEITFRVTDGPNEGESLTAESDEDGQATFTYISEDVGTDTIVATHEPDEGDALTSNDATIEWAEVLEEVEEVEEAEPAEPVEEEPDFTG